MAIDPGYREGVALLVIDVQWGLFQRANPVYQAEALLANLNSLMDRARAANCPPIFVQHANTGSLKYGTEAWQLHPQIRPLEGELVIHKRYGNAFQETELEAVLAERGVGQLVICGLVTHGCVRHTCEGALGRNYQVLLVEDGHSVMNKKALQTIRNWNRRLARSGAEVRPAAEIDFASL